MEVIKDTILKQDLMFRMQVHELHRIYWAQNFPVKDLGCRELDRRNSLSTTLQTPVFPLKDVTEDASPPDNSRLSYTNKVALTTFSSQGLSAHFRSKHHRIQKWPLDFQLTSDEIINNAVEETPKNWIILDRPERPMDTMHCLSSANFLDEEDIELSLGLREEKKRKRGRMGKWNYKATQPCYQNVIDLEDSDEQEDSCRIFPPLGNCASASVYSKGDHDMVSFTSPSMLLTEEKKSFAEILKCWSTEERIACYQVQAPPNTGNSGCHDVFLHHHLSTKEQQGASGQGWKLDLNEPLVDDTSQTESIVAGTEEVTCLTPSVGENLRYLNKGSEIIQHNSIMDQTSSVLGGESKSTYLNPIENFKQSTEPADRTTGPETVSISEGLDNSSCTEQKNEDIGAPKSRVVVSFLDVSDCKLTSAGVLSSEKSVTENIAHSCTSHNGKGVEEGRGDKSPVSWKSCCTSDNVLSSAKSIQSGLHYAALETHPKTSSRTQCVDLLPNQHEDATMKSIDQSEESMAVLQRAAELLVQLSSLKNPSFDQDSSSKAISKEIDDNNGNQPLHPADSFELMVLQLPEDMYDECTSSKPPVSNDTETNDISRKFRRGRRMKDFQKEILPTIASLSVHEIREDVNILEGVLRSREYRRTRAKMAAHDHNWSAVKISKRSRTNVRRRILA